MFWFRESLPDVEIGFTDASIDLGRLDDDVSLENRRVLGESLGASRVRSMRQVHGTTVAAVDATSPDWPEADALTTWEPGAALLVRVADCTPIILVDRELPRVAVVHAGREGLVKGVVPAAVTALRGDLIHDLEAWVGPRACGRCYELPEDMVAAVEAAVPGTRSTTSWGTPAVDVGRGVVSQLEALGVEVHDIGEHVCTIEDEQFFSHRRQGVLAGRMGAVAMLT